MDLAEYRQCVERIPFGKRVHSAVYVYRVERWTLGDKLDVLLTGIAERCGVSAEFNLVKFRTDELKVSFLAYPDFDCEPHPALRHAITIDLVTGKARHTDYAGNINPPILHRKETFLPAGHPLRAQFEALTRAEEAAGLYERTVTIGFKLNWEKLLASKGLVIRGHILASADGASARANSEEVGAEMGSVAIERHKTALTRYDLSKPVKTLLEYGVLRPGEDLFRLRVWTGQ